MSDAIVGAVIGAAIASIFGLLGAILLRWLDILRDRDRARSEYQAALRLVSDELEGNIQTARLIVKEGAKVPPAFGHTTYHDMQMILALHLGSGDRLKVAKAYEPVRVPQALGREVLTQSVSGQDRYYFEPNLTKMQSATA